MEDICLMIFFRRCLAEPLQSVMPLHDPNWTLDIYNDLALRLSSTAFTVGVVDEDRKMATTPQPSTVMVSSETRPVMSAIPEFLHKMAASKEIIHKMESHNGHRSRASSHHVPRNTKSIPWCSRLGSNVEDPLLVSV